MAKRRKTPPVRKSREAQVEEHSLLIRSAESLGRVIGALQRQLDDASRRIAYQRSTANNGSNGQSSKRKAAKKKKTAAKRKRTTH